MLKITLGEMLKRFRIEKQIEARLVSEGLCSTAMMSYFENGEKVPDTLLFEYMMERMGVSPELFSIMVSQEEYEYYEWKEQVCEAIASRDYTMLEKLLASKVPKKNIVTVGWSTSFCSMRRLSIVGIVKNMLKLRGCLKRRQSKRFQI